MEISVLAQLVPRTVFLRSLRNTGLFPRGEVLPRIVASDAQQRPIGAFQVLHQYVPSARVADPTRHFAKHFLQLLSMTWSRAVVGNGISRAGRLRLRIGVNTHGAAELLP